MRKAAIKFSFSIDVFLSTRFLSGADRHFRALDDGFEGRRVLSRLLVQPRALLLEIQHNLYGQRQVSRVDELVRADPWPWRGDVCLQLVLLPNTPFPQPVSSFASDLDVYAPSASSR